MQQFRVSYFVKAVGEVLVRAQSAAEAALQFQGRVKDSRKRRELVARARRQDTVPEVEAYCVDGQPVRLAGAGGPASGVVVQLHDVVFTAREAELPVECPSCKAAVAEAGVDEVCWVDVGVFSHVEGGQVVAQGESKYGECYKTVAYECAACHEVLLGGLEGPRG